MSNKDPAEMSTKTSQGKTEGRSLGFLKVAGLIALIVGTAGSLFFMFRAGQQTPRLLLVLFTIWVLSPFAALLWAIKISQRWSVLIQATVYCVMLIVALGSLAIYSEWIDVRPAESANAFLFVAVPPTSLIFIAIVIPVVALISGRLSRSGEGT